jgi:hypothetical protein
MALTPFRIAVLLVSTLVLSVLGVALIAIGVHGPQVVAMIGGFLLLPCIMLTRLGLPVGIPFIHSTGILSILVFMGLQTAYYYALLQLIYFVTRGRGRKS